jgi:uroporphyrinogen-III decarboxylase
MDMDLFRQFYRPRYQRIIDAAHNAGMHYIWHNCGKVDDMLNDKIEMGVDVVQFDQPQLSGHDQLIAITGGKLCMWNTVDIQWSVLDEVTPSDIEREVETMIEAYKPNDFNGGFIARHYPQPWDIELSVEKQKIIHDAFMANGCALDS